MQAKADFAPEVKVLVAGMLQAAGVPVPAAPPAALPPAVPPASPPGGA
jgi:hypothetical protein